MSMEIAVSQSTRVHQVRTLAATGERQRQRHNQCDPHTMEQGKSRGNTEFHWHNGTDGSRGTGTKRRRTKRVQSLILDRQSEVDALNARDFLVEETLLSALAYQPRPSDVFIVSYPKCGSALLQFLVFGIWNRGSPSRDFADFVERSPYLEWMGIKSVLEMRRPGAIKTHLPFEKNPYSPQAKYIYVARNPFDCCASYYMHMKNMPLSRPESASFDAFFDAFLKGKVLYGDYFDHLLTWYDHRNDPNVLFITYEDVKTDPGTSTIRIAEFVDQVFARELQEDPVLLANVLNTATANSMSATCHQGMQSILSDELAMTVGRAPITPGEFYKNVFAEALEIAEVSDFTRKPICGKWKELFKPEHIHKMKEWIAEKTVGSEVLSIWANSELP
ncbi:hypothetical protein HPB50_029143 [Hyalomma asiaticum]|nr:hypothetical protein HPB50_029143 [Hyalomma asiaticum]